MRLASVKQEVAPPVIHLLPCQLNGRRPLGIIINQIYLEQALKNRYQQKCESLEEMRFLAIAKKLPSVTIWSNSFPGLILEVTDGGKQRAVPGLTLRPKTGRVWAVTYDPNQLRGRVTDQDGRFRVNFGGGAEDGWFEIPVQRHGFHSSDLEPRANDRKWEGLTLQDLESLVTFIPKYSL